MTRADPAVAARQQALDDAGLAVVIAHADRAAVRLSAGSRRAACAAGVDGLGATACAAHWNGVCALGTNPPIETVQRMSRVPEACGRSR
jgi:hypothetical protein